MSWWLYCTMTAATVWLSWPHAELFACLKLLSLSNRDAQLLNKGQPRPAHMCPGPALPVEENNSQLFILLVSRLHCRLPTNYIHRVYKPRAEWRMYPVSTVKLGGHFIKLVNLGLMVCTDSYVVKALPECDGSVLKNIWKVYGQTKSAKKLPHPSSSDLMPMDRQIWPHRVPAGRPSGSLLQKITSVWKESQNVGTSQIHCGMSLRRPIFWNFDFEREFCDKLSTRLPPRWWKSMPTQWMTLHTIRSIPLP